MSPPYCDLLAGWVTEGHTQHEARAEALVLCAHEKSRPLLRPLSWKEAAASERRTPHGRWRRTFLLLPRGLSLRLPAYLAFLWTFLGCDGLMTVLASLALLSGTNMRTPCLQRLGHK